LYFDAAIKALSASNRAGPANTIAFAKGLSAPVAVDTAASFDAAYGFVTENHRRRDWELPKP
jgi:hypothetical protein